MPSVFLFLGAACAFIGVAMGAFGAHGLKTMISPELLTVYQTGVTYQMWHAFGLIAIALMQQHDAQSKLLKWAGALMFLGIILFSGSLYLLAILNLPALGAITPLGGVSFLIAWSLLIIFSGKKSTHHRYRKSSRY
ncbi:MAG: DUF423 domain-containing protein [Methylococcales bacterium]|nr:DUF423 domain-containing protein [Methylococcales bacterium]MDD5755620.1 DUF423 domain-containing protein [Methylococcales bacterium]